MNAPLSPELKTNTKPVFKTVTANEVIAAALPNSVIIDVRSPGEFAAVYVDKALNLPLDICSDERMKEMSQRAGVEHVYVMCQSGQRARMACDKLSDLAMIEKIQIIEGGISAWQQAGGAVRRGKGAISLERQVRIVAGFLVALGVALGYWVHSGFLGISGFVGLGLMFAGITDFCGMGLILAKMPWNKRGSSALTCSR